MLEDTGLVFRRAAGAALGPLARWLTAGQPRILFYHRFAPDGGRALAPEAFEYHLAYLTRHFVPMPLSRLIEARRGGAPLPRRAVVLTVDDGYRDFLDHAYPLLEKYAVPATLYVVSEFAAGNLWLWFDRLRYVCEQAKVARLAVPGEADATAFPLGTRAERERAWDVLSSRCLTLRTAEREDLIEDLAAVAEVSLPGKAPHAFAPAGIDALRALDPALVDIGAHTRSHPILSMCSDPEVADEVIGSVRSLTAALGRPVTSFCYPNGRPVDFDRRAIDAARAAGCSNATASTGMLLPAVANPFALPRFGAAHEASTFRHEMDGLTYLQSRLTGRHVDVPAGEMAGRAARPRPA